MEKKKELVVSVIFDGHDGERYKIPTCENDIEKITLLNCGKIDCLCHEINCKNCIFHKGKTFRKGELELIVEEKEKEKGYSLEDLEDLEEIKDFNEDTKRFILFKDKQGREQLLPYLSKPTVKYEELEARCRGVNCVEHYELNCRKCPFNNHGKLSPGEFKILKPKNKRLEEE